MWSINTVNKKGILHDFGCFRAGAIRCGCSIPLCRFLLFVYIRQVCSCPSLWCNEQMVLFGRQMAGGLASGEFLCLAVSGASAPILPASSHRAGTSTRWAPQLRVCRCIVQTNAPSLHMNACVNGPILDCSYRWPCLAVGHCVCVCVCLPCLANLCHSWPIRWVNRLRSGWHHLAQRWSTGVMSYCMWRHRQWFSSAVGSVYNIDTSLIMTGCIVSIKADSSVIYYEVIATFFTHEFQLSFV